MGLFDGPSFGIAVGSISIVIFLTRRLPIPVAWLGVVTAAAILLGGPAQLILTGTIGGLDPDHPSAAGFIVLVSGVLLPILWIVVTGLLLLIRPVWKAKATTQVDS